MPAESVVKTAEIARELNFVTKGTLVITDTNNVLIQLVTGEGTAPSVVGEVSFLMGATLLAVSECGSLTLGTLCCTLTSAYQCYLHSLSCCLLAPQLSFLLT